MASFPQKALHTPDENRLVLLSTNTSNKDEISRIVFFLEWLEQNRFSWSQPHLSEYRTFLLTSRTRAHSINGTLFPATLSPQSANAHLATLRGLYRTLLTSSHIRQYLYEHIPAEITDPADRKALVDEVLLRIQHDINPRNTAVPQPIQQDKLEPPQQRLTPEHVSLLVRQPTLSTLNALRDTAIIALMVCTGIREAELVQLDVGDLRQQLGSELALLIRKGKNNKQRLVPYGTLDWCLIYVDVWLKTAKITNGAVFRGIYKGNKHIRPTRLTTRAIYHIMSQYPISINGQLVAVHPHDLRRTYARNAYLHGMDIERIRQNLGHSDLKTTQLYIGTLDANHRRPPQMYLLPHTVQELAHIVE